MLVCLDRKVVSLFECGEHVASAKPPHSRSLTAAQKDFAKQMARAGMKPARIRMAMLLNFGLRPSELPALQKMQNVVCYYRRAQLDSSDTTATIVAEVRARAFTGGEEEHQPFTLGWNLDKDGRLVVGNGSDEKPFLVGFLTKALLRQGAKGAGTFIFHVDATYKTNQVGYPVIVCGITDAAQTFHLLALFVTSQQQEGHYVKAFAALRWVYSKVVEAPLCVFYVMGDADAAQYNALVTVFGGDCNYTHLMCYYHLIAKVVERTKGLPKEIGDSVLRDIYDMHYCRSSEEFTTTRTAAELRWESNDLLMSLHSYFKRVWLNHRFCRWQCFHTSPGFATTTNPVEQLNRALKRDYTAHRLLKMGGLLQQLAACCRQRTVDIRLFALSPVASKELLARVKVLRSQKLLREYLVPRMSVDFLLLDCSSDVVHVLYTPPQRAYNAATNTMQEAVQAQCRSVSTRREWRTSSSRKRGGRSTWPANSVRVITTSSMATVRIAFSRCNSAHALTVIGTKCW